MDIVLVGVAVMACVNVMYIVGTWKIRNIKKIPELKKELECRAVFFPFTCFLFGTSVFLSLLAPGEIWWENVVFIALYGIFAAVNKIGQYLAEDTIKWRMRQLKAGP